MKLLNNHKIKLLKRVFNSLVVSLLLLVVCTWQFKATTVLGIRETTLFDRTPEKMTELYTLVCEHRDENGQISDQWFMPTPLGTVSGPFGAIITLFGGDVYIVDSSAESPPIVEVNYKDNVVKYVNERVMYNPSAVMKSSGLYKDEFFETTDSCITKAQTDEVKKGMTSDEVYSLLGSAYAYGNQCVLNVITYKISDSNFAHVFFKPRTEDGKTTAYVEKVTYSENTNVDRKYYAFNLWFS